MHGFLTALRYLGLGLWWLVRNLILAPLQWAAVTMFGQARTGLQRLLRPFLWPAVGILAFLVLYNTTDQQVFTNLLIALLAPVIFGIGLLMVVRGRLPFGAGRRR